MASTIRRLVPDESSDEEKVSSTSQQKSVKFTGYKRSLSTRSQRKAINILVKRKKPSPDRRNKSQAIPRLQLVDSSDDNHFA